MKRGPFIFILALALIAMLVAAGVALLHDGLSSRATPSRLESYLARSTRKLAIPASAKALTNPVSGTLQSLREGRLHFADHCAVCHGNDGGGETLFGVGLYPKPPDLRLPETQKLSDGDLFWIIENGVRFTGMPAFSGHGAAEEDTWKLVHFIRHLPHLTPEELSEMDRYNPKSPEDRAEEQQEEEFLSDKPPGGKGEDPDAHPHKRKP
jgi:mono/diheme cytochrome c family protein